MTDTQVTWLTQEAHDRLKAELDQLIAHRPIIAAEINDRREEGDLRENGGYHAAREEQGQEEARIRQLQELLNNAKVGEAPKQSGVALPGSVVTVDYDDDKSDKETFLIATRQEGVSDGKLEVYSPNSPLGSALIDAKEGETPHLHGAQRQHRQGDAGQGRALSLLTRPRRRQRVKVQAHGADRRGLVSTAVGQRRLAARPGPVATRARAVGGGAAGPGAAVPRPTRDERRSRSRRADWWRWRGRCRWTPSWIRRSTLLARRPLTPAAAVSKLRRRSPGQHRPASRTHRSDPACSVAEQAIQPSLRRGR